MLYQTGPRLALFRIQYSYGGSPCLSGSHTDHSTSIAPPASCTEQCRLETRDSNLSGCWPCGGSRHFTPLSFAHELVAVVGRCDEHKRLATIAMDEPGKKPQLSYPLSTLSTPSSRLQPSVFSSNSSNRNGHHQDYYHSDVRLCLSASFISLAHNSSVTAMVSSTRLLSPSSSSSSPLARTRPSTPSSGSKSFACGAPFSQMLIVPSFLKGRLVAAHRR